MQTWTQATFPIKCQSSKIMNLEVTRFKTAAIIQEGKIMISNWHHY